jgi:PIN domain nuclease of toxin-antitoxin system
MSDVLADTHAIVWYLFDPVRLSPVAHAALTAAAQSLIVLPLDLAVAQAMDQVPRAEVPDMPDRVVAATAVAHDLSLVSVDSDI